MQISTIYKSYYFFNNILISIHYMSKSREIYPLTLSYFLSKKSIFFFHFFLFVRLFFQNYFLFTNYCINSFIYYLYICFSHLLYYRIHYLIPSLYCYPFHYLIVHVCYLHFLIHNLCTLSTYIFHPLLLFLIFVFSLNF